jgi:hypothetical protein
MVGMIDEKRLESLQKKPDQANYITKPELDDLLRLARLGLMLKDKADLGPRAPEELARLLALGLWAEKHAIPVLTQKSRRSSYPWEEGSGAYSPREYSFEGEIALAKYLLGTLPKEKT